MEKLPKTILALRQSGSPGHYRSTNKPVSFVKGTLYEMIRPVADQDHALIRVDNVIYLARRADLVATKPSLMREQTIQHPQQMADFMPPPSKPVSLDQVVDRYIVRYERESIPLEGEPGPGPAPGAAPAGDPNLTMEGLLEYLLSEQAPPPAEDDPDAPPPDDTAPPADDAGGGLDLGGGGGGGGDLGDAPDDASGGGGGGGGAPEGPPVVNTPKINLNDFARSVARLVNNFNALLNPQTIILNRVEAYIASNYDERTAKQFMQIMERNYGVHPTDTEYPERGSEFPTPYSGEATLGGGGGGG